jgi:anti-sigma-K factor RskA
MIDDISGCESFPGSPGEASPGQSRHRASGGWRVASVTVSLVSVALIALTLGYRLRGAELPAVLLLALLAAFATVVLLLSKFLFWAQKEEGQITGALNTSEREFQSVFENALAAS